MWQPDFIPGFQASVDYYRIGVKGAIIALGLQQVEDLCFFSQTQGLTSATCFCNQDAITTANGVNQSVGQSGGRRTVPTALHRGRLQGVQLRQR